MPILSDIPSCQATFETLRLSLPQEYDLYCLTDPLPDYPKPTVVEACIVAPDVKEIEDCLNTAGYLPEIQAFHHDQNLYIYQFSIKNRLVKLRIMEGQPKETTLRSVLIELQTKFPCLIPMVLATKKHKLLSTHEAWCDVLDLSPNSDDLNTFLKQGEQKQAWLKSYLDHLKKENP